MFYPQRASDAQYPVTAIASRHIVHIRARDQSHVLFIDHRVQRRLVWNRQNSTQVGVVITPLQVGFDTPSRGAVSGGGAWVGGVLLSNDSETRIVRLDAEPRHPHGHRSSRAGSLASTSEPHCSRITPMRWYAAVRTDADTRRQSRAWKPGSSHRFRIVLCLYN